MTLDEDRVDDGTTREERIRTTYMQLLFYERAIFSISNLEKDAMSRENLAERQELLEKAQKARKELNEAFTILTDNKLRETYDKELRAQEYVESLRRDKLARIKLSEMYVKSVLGKDFNPDMFLCKYTSRRSN